LGVTAKEKDELLKKNAKLETEMANLRSRAASAENEKKKADCLQSLYDANHVELSELKLTHDKPIFEHDTYCDEVEHHVGHVYQKLHDLLVNFGITPAPHNINTMYIGPLFKWLSNVIGSLALARRSFVELGATVSARILAHSICSLLKLEGDSELSVTKSDLHLLRDLDFTWPTETSVDKIPALPKNITKIFM
jgi:hypothetical protein